MLIKFIIPTIITICMIFVPLNLYASPKFIPGINGLPLMSGFEVIPETQVVFNTPSGRIIEVSVIGKLPPIKILPFYKATLSQLGWVHISDNKFLRENDLLKVEVVDNQNGQFVVRFSVITNSD